MNPSVAVVSKFDRQGAERKRGYGVNASPLSEGCRFERAHPACCVPFDSAGLKTTEQFPFPVECRLVALFGSAAMSELSPLCAPKRTSANTYGFMGKHLVVPQFLAFKLLKEIS